MFFDVETLNSELESEKFIEFAALRVRNGQIHESCRYLLQPDQGVIGKWHTDLQIEKLGNELPLSGDHQEIMNFLGDAVLVGHEISVCLSILERKLNVRFQQPLWDTLDLSKVFFQICIITNCHTWLISFHYH